jgi:hypothetical protein
MSRTCANLLALCLALCLAPGCGCGSSSKPPVTGGSGSGSAEPEPPGPPGLDHDYEQLADRAVKLYEDVAELLRTVGEDCEQATAKLNELSAANRDVIAANSKVLREGRAREIKKALAKQEDRFNAAAKVIMESQTISRCAHYSSFTKAFDELVASPP